MSWEHDMAKELNSNRNRNDPVWFSGKVLSPSVTGWSEDGTPVLSGSLQVSAYDGQLMLDGSHLRVLTSAGAVYQGQTVALLGNPFGKSPGSQKILILGVIGDAV